MEIIKGGLGHRSCLPLGKKTNPSTPSVDVPGFTKETTQDTAGQDQLRRDLSHSMGHKCICRMWIAGRQELMSGINTRCELDLE